MASLNVKIKLNDKECTNYYIVNIFLIPDYYITIFSAGIRENGELVCYHC